jgi:hypothetical protein
MKYMMRRLRWTAALFGAIALAAVTAGSARAQGQQPPVPPQWMQDAAPFYSGDPARILGLWPFNRYLTLWQYWKGDDRTRFNIWTNLGDPLNPIDDFRFYFEDTDGDGDADNYVDPWGGLKVAASRRPTQVDNSRPMANFTTLRIDDPADPTGFVNLDFPDDGAQMLAPPVATLPNGQGTFSPWRFTGGTGAATYEIQVNQKLQYARDMMRIEYQIFNAGGSAKRVGVRLMLNPGADEEGFISSFFFPQTRQRLFFEQDYGRAIGTTQVPRFAQIPETYELFAGDEDTNPFFITKGILIGNGATTPDRVVFGNALNFWRDIDGGQLWDYRADPNWELRISDLGTLIYWDPIVVPAGQRRSFVTYIGMGVANHGMSNAYLRAQALNTSFADETQGYVAAVQSPFALPLRDTAPRDGVDDPVEANVTAYVQNEYVRSQLPSAFAVIELPEGLTFGESIPNQSQVLSLGSPDAVGFQNDETSGSWTVQADGRDAGILPITVTFNNAFLDSVRVVRFMNVPQGRRYQLGDEYKLITIPYTYNNLADDPAQVLGLAANTFKIFRWNPQALNASGQRGDYEEPKRLIPGESYWIKLLGLGNTMVNLRQANAVEVDTYGDVITRITTGWNMVGNPSPYAVPVRDLRFVATGGLLLTFDQAVSAQIIKAGLYEWNPKTRAYVQLTRDSVIQPGHGIWVYANGEQNIAWPPPYGPERLIAP